MRRLTVADFWARVDRTADCWNWLGSVNDKGYGSVTFQGRSWRAHRLSYELLVGEIPAGLEIDHLCRNRACVNPGHLEPVDHITNIDRAMRSHCPNGHEYTEENTYIGPPRHKHERQRRECRPCRRASQTVRRRARARAAERDAA